MLQNVTPHKYVPAACGRGPGGGVRERRRRAGGRASAPQLLTRARGGAATVLKRWRRPRYCVGAACQFRGPGGLGPPRGGALCAVRP